MDDLYPAGPSEVPKDLTTPSPAYWLQAWLATLSLVVFVLGYFALSGWFVYTAWRTLAEQGSSSEGSFMNQLVGCSSAFLALFMLKALFFVKRGGAPDAVEITEAEQPRLIAFLHRLADEAGAPRPRKVFVSARVNAAVFYDLSILNLLFPSKKNLEIGLALVNVLSLSEMKAVLAHEFGHFAQRSMAIGSWVYIAQQVASHVIAKRDALDELLQFIASIDLRVAWVGWLLQSIVWSIRSLMDMLLRVVVLAQRALSRQMEFQADLVAVSLTGSDELVHALHKLQAADDAWSRTLGFANAQIGQGRIPHDLFEVQTTVIEKMARILDDEHYGQVPPTGERPEAHRVFANGFARPPQMWSSHPANADREQNAKRSYLQASHDPRSAWLLFDDAERLKARVVALMTSKLAAEPATREATLAALDERYGLLQYQPCYRGAYLGRSLTRYAKDPAELYTDAVRPGQVPQLLDTLYSLALADDLTHLRELLEERAMLRAVHGTVFLATGGRIVFRGREIARKRLPEAIKAVEAEAEAVRARVFAHDRAVRATHLAAAELVGNGWREYLIGLIRVLHYAEHTLADLHDAHGLMGNVVAAVAARGKVSSSGLSRLLTTANVLYGVLDEIHSRKVDVRLDATLCERLEINAWSEALEEFKLVPASKENLNNWMQAIDGWVNAAAGLLSALETQALEALLTAEAALATHVRQGTSPPPAPEPSRTPKNYEPLIPGSERPRQTRQDLWSRFQTADGLLASIGRVAVAGGIVASVLGAGMLTASNSTLSIYNGLGRPVSVKVGNQSVTVAAFSATELSIPISGPLPVEARSGDGRLIDSYQPDLSGHGAHYVYNVAAASPLVEWTASYGSAPKVPPHMLGARHWFSTHVDVYFGDAPQSVSTKGSGATRTVLSGVGEREPREQLGLVEQDDERIRIVRLHAQWDEPHQPNTEQWKTIAQRVGTGS
ncbi:hypothetical protein GCM10025771_08730 [Niveibacterium umoris]